MMHLWAMILPLEYPRNSSKYLQVIHRPTISSGHSYVQNYLGKQEHPWHASIAMSKTHQTFRQIVKKVFDAQD